MHSPQIRLRAKGQWKGQRREESRKLCADTISAPRRCLLFCLGCDFWGACNYLGFAPGDSILEQISPSYAHENTLGRQLL